MLITEGYQSPAALVGRRLATSKRDFVCLCKDAPTTCWLKNEKWHHFRSEAFHAVCRRLVVTGRGSGGFR